MAYARWGDDSEWYIYWSTSGGDTIDSQLLEMWHSHAGMHSATYGQIEKEILSGRSALDTIPEDAREKINEHDRERLRECVSRWIVDVGIEFPHRGRPRVIRKHQKRSD